MVQSNHRRLRLHLDLAVALVLMAVDLLDATVVVGRLEHSALECLVAEPAGEEPEGHRIAIDPEAGRLLEALD